jgi:hypothetical protein
VAATTVGPVVAVQNQCVWGFCGFLVNYSYFYNSLSNI